MFSLYPLTIGPSQAIRNGIRAGELRDFDSFTEKLRKLAVDGSKRFDGWAYDVEADIAKYKKILPDVLPLISDSVRPATPLQPPISQCVRSGTRQTMNCKFAI